MTDDQFFDRAEETIVEALARFAAHAHNGHAVHRRLFVDDAARGLGFVDVCRQQYDVVLMKPPFGDSSKPARGLLEKQYPCTKTTCTPRSSRWACGASIRGACWV